MRLNDQTKAIFNFQISDFQSKQTAMPSKYNPDAAHYRRPSVTAYNRLLPTPVSIDYERNLRGEINDPLWLLARQWQMGEFKGEDGGSPIFARVESSQLPMQTLRLDASAPPEKYNAQQLPLEAAVEREAILVGAHLRIQAGFYFQKLLKLKNLAAHHSLFVETYPLPMDDLAAWDTKGQQLLKAARGQLADGFLIIEDARNGGRFENFVKSKFPNAPALSDALLTVAESLSQWLDRTYPTIVHSMEAVKPKAWKQEQLEYGFAFEIDGNADTVRSLRSDDYADGQLDWSDFTLEGDGALPDAVKKTETFVPTAVRYQGMPRPRFWEMEEGRVNFGMISTSPSNILSMAFSEFGLAYSNDWHWIPMPLKINSLCRVDSLVVTDVFGEKTIYAAAPPTAGDPLAIFSLYQLSKPDNSAAQSILYMPPTIAKIQAAEPLERVYFLRDELSNLAWAIETVSPSATQSGVEASANASRQPEESTENSQLIYKLGAVSPENWTPFVPVRLESSNQIRLQRAFMPDGAPPKGQILRDAEPRKKPYFIREEEVGRAGIVVERSWQRARWLNGKTFTWIGRRKTTGKTGDMHNLSWDSVS